MKDNLIYFILGTTLAIGALNEGYKDTTLPKTAAWYQEGKKIKEEKVVSAPVIEQDKIHGEFSDPGPVNYIVDTGATGPPKQDGYPRSPKEIKAILEQNKNEFGLIH